jgi:hypothetical protein
MLFLWKVVNNRNKELNKYARTIQYWVSLHAKSIIRVIILRFIKYELILGKWILVERLFIHIANQVGAMPSLRVEGVWYNVQSCPMTL